MKRNLLIVDKDRTYAKGLKYSLEQDDYTIDVIHHGKATLDRLKQKPYDLIILDEGLRDIDGLKLCRKIREISHIPIIVLSDQSDDVTKVLALETGADDFLEKPFNILELKARIKTIFRRIEYEAETGDKHIMKINDFTIDSLRRKVSLGKEDINFTGKEFELFYVLLSNPGKILTREKLLEKVWGYAYYGDVRTVDVHIRRIRKKIEENINDSQYIMTKWGQGYYFNNS